jgi:hypothetical protein
VGLVYDPRELPGVTTTWPGVAGVLQMVLEPHVFTGVYIPVEKDMVVYRSGTWVRTHDAWVLCEGHGMVHMLLTGYMVRVCQYWTY